jgi:hypothetical protein
MEEFPEKTAKNAKSAKKHQRKFRAIRVFFQSGYGDLLPF